MIIKKLIINLLVILFLVNLVLPSNIKAKEDKISSIMSNMSNEDKIAQMVMLSFREDKNIKINKDNIKDILSKYNYAGVILFSENTSDIETTANFIDFLQSSNKDHPSRLFIAIDQEGGYVTRLGIGTTTPGNMALTASNDPKNAYEVGSIIGSELKALGINTNFGPVVDINNNPANPVIGIRSFSDDANTVATFANEYMKGLQNEGIISTLKHFPGHGDTNKDSHTGSLVINKSYLELKNNELIPFQKLINNGVEMVMVAHIEYPQIETNKYISKLDNKEYYLPATLSKTILTDILRKEMNYNGIIITDALNMGAIKDNFEMEDASIKAINAGADILLMPFTYDKEKDDIDAYISSLASKIGTVISLENVNNSVKRILKLKEEKGLLEEYDNTNIETNINKAKDIVSSKEHHDKEFEIAKESITMVKNTDNVLPLDTNDKTVVLYEYQSHIKAVTNALDKLIANNNTINKDNILIMPMFDNNDNFLITDVKESIKDAKNVIIISSTYSINDLKNSNYDNYNKIIEYTHLNKGNAILISAQLPYDVEKYNEADAIILTYLANGIRIDLNDYEKEIPKYGPNIMAAIYMIFSQNENLNGVLPVNIYKIDNNKNFTSEILYKRGYGLKYTSNLEEDNTTNLEENNTTNSESNIKEELKNPKTNDKLVKYIIIFTLNIILLLGIVIYIKEYN